MCYTVAYNCQKNQLNNTGWKTMNILVSTTNRGPMNRFIVQWEVCCIIAVIASLICSEEKLIMCETEIHVSRQIQNGAFTEICR